MSANLSARDNHVKSLRPSYAEARLSLAARRWLLRYLSEGTPSLRDVAKVTASLAERKR